MQNDTIFRKIPKLKIEFFTKFFYPGKSLDNNAQGFVDSDSDEAPDEQIIGNKTFDGKSVDGSSLISTSRNREITGQLRLIEQ